jgi:hypothetical protein
MLQVRPDNEIAWCWYIDLVYRKNKNTPLECWAEVSKFKTSVDHLEEVRILLLKRCHSLTQLYRLISARCNNLNSRCTSKTIYID